MAWNWRRLIEPSPRPPFRSKISIFITAVATILFVVLAYLHQHGIRLPPNTLPWEPVDLNAPPGWIAHWQLNRLADDGSACRAALGATPIVFTRLKDRKIDGACGNKDVVRADVTPITFKPRTTATCALTAALFWYQQALQKAAEAELHTRIARIDQLGTFACRNVNSEAGGSRSQHATANAIDVAAFHFADGTTATVLADFGRPTAKGRFLSDAHDAACAYFNAVLGPHYNKLHANHFHLDMGPYRICS